MVSWLSGRRRKRGGVGGEDVSAGGFCGGDEKGGRS